MPKPTGGSILHAYACVQGTGTQAGAGTSLQVIAHDTHNPYPIQIGARQQKQQLMVQPTRLYMPTAVSLAYYISSVELHELVQGTGMQASAGTSVQVTARDAHSLSQLQACKLG